MESARLEVIEDELSGKIISYAKYIKENPLSPNKEKILEINKEINEELRDLVYENNIEAFENLPHIFDAIKNRLVSLDKSGNVEERELLKTTKKTFLNSYELYKSNIEEKNNGNNSYCEIINYFLLAEKNYLELKSIIEKNHRIINTRINGEHMVLHILDLYVENFEKMLKKEKHISKDYLKEIYFLFTKNFGLTMSLEEKKKIDTKLDKFQSHVKKLIKKRGIYNQTLLEIKSLRSNNFYIEEKYLSGNNKEVDYNELEKQIKFIISEHKNLLEDSSRVDLISENIICIGGGTSAYSTLETEKGTILKLHILDIKDYIKKGSPLDIYLYNCLYKGIQPDRDISDFLIFIKGKTYPTITYELEIAKNGILCDLKIYPSKIEIKNKIGELSYLPEEYKKTFKRISNQLGMSVEYKGVKDITHVFEKAFSKKVSQYMYEHRIPFIYSGSKYQTIKSSDVINNDLIGCLNSLNKKELKTIKKIIEDHNDSFHYSARYLGDDGKYSLAITSPISYLNLEYQRTIEMFIFDKDKDPVEVSNLKRKMKKRNESLARLLNSSIKYVETESILENKGKIKTYRDIDKRF